MTRDSASILERRNERARAAGFTSYAQQRRAKTEGYRDAGSYQASVEARHNPVAAVIRAATRGQLLGGRAMRTGAVFAADFTDDASVAAQWRALLRFRPDRRATIAVEMTSGYIFHLGADHGGYRLSYLRELVRTLGDWPAAVEYLVGIVKAAKNKSGKPADDDDDEEGEPDEIEVVTVTVI